MYWRNGSKKNAEKGRKFSLNSFMFAFQIYICMSTSNLYPMENDGKKNE